MLIPFRVMVIKVVEMNKTLNRLANQKNEINYDLTKKDRTAICVKNTYCKQHIMLNIDRFQDRDCIFQ